MNIFQNAVAALAHGWSVGRSSPFIRTVLHSAALVSSALLALKLSGLS